MGDSSSFYKLGTAPLVPASSAGAGLSPPVAYFVTSLAGSAITTGTILIATTLHVS